MSWGRNVINALEGLGFNYNVCVRCIYILIKPSWQVWMWAFSSWSGGFALPNYFWTQKFRCHRCRNALKSFWMVFAIAGSGDECSFQNAFSLSPSWCNSWSEGFCECGPPCSEVENLALIADTLDASCLMNINLRGNVRTRYFVGGRTGFGFIFELVGGVWNLCTSGILGSHLSRGVYFCYRFQSLFPCVIFEKMIF